jgi:hypothetical protein
MSEHFEKKKTFHILNACPTFFYCDTQLVPNRYHNNLKENKKWVKFYIN